jgi:antirestriction protein
MKIYVASLSDYNNGVLHGCWIDCEGKSGDDIQAEVSAMLRGSRYPNVTVPCPDCDGTGRNGSNTTDGTEGDDCATCSASGLVPSAEEWAIHAQEGFGSLVGESTPLDRVAGLAELIEEHGEAFIAYAENIGDDATGDGFQEAYQGEFDSLADWAEEFMESTGGLEAIPENLRYYFDYEAYGRDAQLGGDIYMLGRHVFWNR